MNHVYKLNGPTSIECRQLMLEFMFVDHESGRENSGFCWNARCFWSEGKDLLSQSSVCLHQFCISRSRLPHFWDPGCECEELVTKPVLRMWSKGFWRTEVWHLWEVALQSFSGAFAVSSISSQLYWDLLGGPRPLTQKSYPQVSKPSRILTKMAKLWSSFSPYSNDDPKQTPLLSPI